eukprot:scaffold117709_cov57-Phaeocystis_antarctica.AAC.1
MPADRAARTSRAAAAAPLRLRRYRVRAPSVSLARCACAWTLPARARWRGPVRPHPPASGRGIAPIRQRSSQRVTAWCASSQSTLCLRSK